MTRWARPEAKIIWAICFVSMTSESAREADLKLSQVLTGLFPKDKIQSGLLEGMENLGELLITEPMNTKL